MHLDTATIARSIETQPADRTAVVGVAPDEPAVSRTTELAGASR